MKLITGKGVSLHFKKIEGPLDTIHASPSHLYAASNSYEGMIIMVQEIRMRSCDLYYVACELVREQEFSIMTDRKCICLCIPERQHLYFKINRKRAIKIPENGFRMLDAGSGTIRIPRKLSEYILITLPESTPAAYVETVLGFHYAMEALLARPNVHPNYEKSLLLVLACLVTIGRITLDETEELTEKIIKIAAFWKEMFQLRKELPGGTAH